MVQSHSSIFPEKSLIMAPLLQYKKKAGGSGTMPFSVPQTAPPAVSGHELMMKRGIDLAGTVLISLLLTPLLLAVYGACLIFQGRPVFFSQERIGLNGRPFTMYKFRTMVVGAQEERARLHTYNEASGPVFKIRNDPRTTAIGAFLRFFSLDELPQLYNVFKGDMSLVGPRPPLPEEVAEYETWHLRRLTMPPGLTCIWQVSGRNEIPFDQWVKLDLAYIDNWSIMEDLLILLRTIPAVLFARGAR